MNLFDPQTGTMGNNLRNIDLDSAIDASQVLEETGRDITSNHLLLQQNRNALPELPYIAHRQQLNSYDMRDRPFKDSPSFAHLQRNNISHQHIHSEIHHPNMKLSKNTSAHPFFNELNYNSTALGQPESMIKRSNLSELCREKPVFSKKDKNQKAKNEFMVSDCGRTIGLADKIHIPEVGDEPSNINANPPGLFFYKDQQISTSSAVYPENRYEGAKREQEVLFHKGAKGHLPKQSNFFKPFEKSNRKDFKTVNFFKYSDSAFLNGPSLNLSNSGAQEALYENGKFVGCEDIANWDRELDNTRWSPRLEIEVARDRAQSINVSGANMYNDKHQASIKDEPVPLVPAPNISASNAKPVDLHKLLSSDSQVTFGISNKEEIHHLRDEYDVRCRHQFYADIFKYIYFNHLNSSEQPALQDNGRNNRRQLPISSRVKGKVSIELVNKSLNEILKRDSKKTKNMLKLAKAKQRNQQDKAKKAAKPAEMNPKFKDHSISNRKASKIGNTFKNTYGERCQ